MSISIDRTEASDLPSVRSLLASAELPTDDLEDPTIALFGAFDGDALVGVIGLQACGDVGLLRSLAVAPSHREHAIARRLCERVFEESRSRGMHGLWLLTTSARDYFTRHAFEVVPRGEVPAAIRATAQFSSLCPASACVMRRSDQGS